MAIKTVAALIRKGNLGQQRCSASRAHLEVIQGALLLELDAAVQRSLTAERHLAAVPQWPPRRPSCADPVTAPLLTAEGAGNAGSQPSNTF